MTIHVDTGDGSHEIAYDRFREMLDGYETLIGTLEDDRTYNVNDTRTQQQETSDMKLSHMLYLLPATEGSYACEARLYDDSDEVNKTLPLYGEGFTRVLTVIDCVSEGNAEKFAEEVPSRLARTRVLEGVKKVCPRNNEQITVITGINQQQKVSLKQADIIPFDFLKPVDDEYTDVEVIGKIVMVDFENKKLWLRPNGASKKFGMNYDPAIEDRLMETRYQLMTVKSKVKYNLNGDIGDIIDVDGIEELELRNIEVKSFDADEVIHRFKSPIVVTVELDETGQIYIATYDDLELCVYAEHQDELRQEIEDDLAWRWTNIAMAPEKDLAPDAIAVRKAFRDLVGD